MKYTLIALFVLICKISIGQSCYFAINLGSPFPTEGYGWYNGDITAVAACSNSTQITLQATGNNYCANPNGSSVYWYYGSATGGRTLITFANSISFQASVYNGKRISITRTSNGTTNSYVDISVMSNAIPTISITPQNATVCKGSSLTLNASGNASSYTWNNGVTNGVAFNPTSSQNYTVTALNTNTAPNCSNSQSVFVNVINITPVTTYTNLSGCNSVNYKGVNYNSSTQFTETIKSVTCNVDSIYNQVNITVNNTNPVTNYTNYTGCNYVNYNGTNYYSSTQILTNTIQNNQGCDIAYEVANIIVYTAIRDTINLTGCTNVNYKGNTYTTSIIFTDTIKNVQGCDSIHRTVNINIYPYSPTTNYLSFENCNSFTYKGITYTTSTIATDTIKSLKGCDSVYNILLITINPIRPVTNSTYFYGLIVWNIIILLIQILQ